MQPPSRLLAGFLATGVRMAHTNPLGPSRGRAAPKWALEKLVNEGYKKEEILSNWEGLLSKRTPRKHIFMDYINYVQQFRDLSFKGLMKLKKKRALEAFREDQNFNMELTRSHGSNVALALFLTERDAAIKLVGRDLWLEGFQPVLNTPTGASKTLRVEAVDLKDFQIIYRAFAYFRQCRDLVSVKMTDQIYVDDFCMDALTGALSNSLEYLDVSGCHLLSERGLCILHRCKKLKLLTAYDLPNVKYPELLKLMLEDCLPGVKIQGLGESRKKSIAKETKAS